MASLSLIDAASRTTMADKAKKKGWVKPGKDAKAEDKPADGKQMPFGKEERRKRLYGKSKD